MKIFIVDDSVMLRNKISDLISKINNVDIIGTSGDVIEAYKKILLAQPDVVILDIRLILGNGIYLLKKIKDEIKNIVVIMFTNYPYPQYRKRCSELGADYFYDKSHDFDKLIYLLSNWPDQAMRDAPVV